MSSSRELPSHTPCSALQLDQGSEHEASASVKVTIRELFSPVHEVRNGNGRLCWSGYYRRCHCQEHSAGRLPHDGPRHRAGGSPATRGGRSSAGSISGGGRPLLSSGLHLSPGSTG